VAERAGSAACCADPRLSLRLIQRALDIRALQLDAKYHLNAQIAGLFGAVGVLFAPIARKIAGRRGPYTVIGLGSAIAMLAVVDDQEKLSTR
jgi:hypothetical protein